MVKRGAPIIVLYAATCEHHLQSARSKCACYHLFHSATTKPPPSSFTAPFNFCFKFGQKTILNLVACPAVHSVRCCWREQKGAEPTPCMQPGSWCHWSFSNGSVGARKWNSFSLFLEFVFLTGGSQAEDEERVSQCKTLQPWMRVYTEMNLTGLILCVVVVGRVCCCHVLIMEKRTSVSRLCRFFTTS